ncbi:MAG: sugar-binding domain-containing protein, partial [Planctomycetota bacterium]
MNKYAPQYDKLLSVGWMIQASSQVRQTGDEISKPDFDTHGWYSASVPSTVLAVLVENGVYENPYFGMNLKNISSGPFKKPWWYRTEFQLSKKDAPAVLLRKSEAAGVLLEFDGINYSANIWLNGNRIAASTEVKGAFRRFKYNITKYITKGTNVLAVEVIAPKPGDFAIGFVDWNPPPPDRNMGIFRSVRLRLCKGVSIENPFIRTELNLETLQEAALTISVELANHEDKTVSGILEGEIESIKFNKAQNIEPQSREMITCTPSEFPHLNIKNPRIWWPHNLGKPPLVAGGGKPNL